jgi:hypothetical protein
MNQDEIRPIQKLNINCRFRSKMEVHSSQQCRSGSAGTKPAIVN